MTVLDANAPWFALALALVLDVIVGDPPNRFHPVAWFGSLANVAKRRLFQPAGPPLEQLLAGTLGTLALIMVAVGLPMMALIALPFAKALLAALLLKASFALRALVAAGARMRHALQASDLDAARAGLGHLCSRSPDDLAPQELAGATIESLAENLSDSFVAPLFYFALFGLPGALAYRAANTLDAMFGYRGKYEWFGKTPARLDDLLNLVPARLTALLLLIAGRLLGHPAARAIGIWRRDCRKTPSPNAGHPMAMMAGLLNVQLDKRGVYALGDAGSPAGPQEISQAIRIMQAAAALFALALLVSLW